MTSKSAAFSCHFFFRYKRFFQVLVHANKTCCTRPFQLMLAKHKINLTWPFLVFLFVCFYNISFHFHCFSFMFLLVLCSMKIKMKNRNCFGKTSTTALKTHQVLLSFSFEVVQEFFSGTTLTKNDNFLYILKIIFQCFMQSCI